MRSPPSSCTLYGAWNKVNREILRLLWRRKSILPPTDGEATWTKSSRALPVSTQAVTMVNKKFARTSTALQGKNRNFGVYSWLFIDSCYT